MNPKQQHTYLNGKETVAWLLLCGRPKLLLSVFRKQRKKLVAILTKISLEKCLMHKRQLAPFPSKLSLPTNMSHRVILNFLVTTLKKGN
jgi:hypothetical protein